MLWGRSLSLLTLTKSTHVTGLDTGAKGTKGSRENDDQSTDLCMITLPGVIIDGEGQEQGRVWRSGVSDRRFTRVADGRRDER